MESIINRINYLRNILNRYNYLYYNTSKNQITDYEYDLLMKELIEIEKKYPELIVQNSPTQKIGYIPLKHKFKIIKHIFPMLSLDNVTYEKDFFLFYNKIKKLIGQNINFCCELKFDGLAVNLLYKKGILISAATRGNGKIGEDITRNIIAIEDIPLKLKGDKLPDIIEIRGEIIMKKSIFSKINDFLLKKGEKKFSNPRNAAIGSIKNHNPYISATRKLSFFCYGIGKITENYKIYCGQFEDLSLLRKLGLPVHNSEILCSNYKDILKFYNKINMMRSKIDFDIDGIVIKVNNQKFYEYLGKSYKFPKWAIAYKFIPQEKLTTINNIEFTVGRTGKITPIAIVEPINIGGTLIKKVTLHNFGNFTKLNLFYKDKIIIRRSGDVIPQISSVIKNNLITGKKFFFPQNCPECFSYIKIQKNKKIAFCTGKYVCKQQICGAIKHFVSKNAINIPYIGNKLIYNLVTQNYIKNSVDLFFLDFNFLVKINFIGIKLANKIINYLKNAKKTTFSRFIYSLGIPKVGINNAQNLAKYFTNLESMMSSTFNDFLKVQDIGDTIAYNIEKFIKQKNNRILIYNLINKVGIFWKKID